MCVPNIDFDIISPKNSIQNIYRIIVVDIHWFQFINFNNRTNEHLTEKIIKVSLRIIIKFKKNPKKHKGSI